MKSFNYYKYRFKYIYSKYLNLKEPVDLMLELSSYCNMRCSYCYHGDKSNLPFKQNFMQLDLAKKILSDAASTGVSSLKFNFRGESTLHPNFEEITAYAKSLANKSVFIDRITNTNIKFSSDREDIFRGLCNQTKVKISFDSFDKYVFETQRDGGNHIIALYNIDKLYNYPGRDNVIVIQAVRTNLNKNEDLAGEIKKRWPFAEISIRDMVSGRINNDLTDLENKKRDFKNRQACTQAFSRLVVRYNGTIGACCPDIREEIYLGDLNKNSILDIWNGENAKLLKEKLKNKMAFNYEPCKSCSSFESFKGYKPNFNS